ncbi:MAG TPA: hypothetical protein VFQ78_07855 [Candidatus Udaeobacter sp.]|nr:hypothetical protein [Candidatus Udaeobacter sp.]
MIRASGIPFTIVRATQFFEFVKGIAQSGGGTAGSEIHLSSVLMQPMASNMSGAVTRCRTPTTVECMIEIAGPDQIRQDELVRQYLKMKGDSRNVVTDDNAGYFGIKVNAIIA